MLKVCLYNLTQDNHILECFEIGRVFNINSHQEEDHLAVIMGGNRLKSNWSNLGKFVFKIKWNILHPLHLYTENQTIKFS